MLRQLPLRTRSSPVGKEFPTSELPFKTPLSQNQLQETLGAIVSSWTEPRLPRPGHPSTKGPLDGELLWMSTANRE